MEEMIAHYEDTKSNTFFSQLINLKQKGSMAEHIEDSQKFNIRLNDIPEKYRIDVFIGTLRITFNMRFAFGNLIHRRRHTGWQEKLWQQGSLPLITIKMEVLLLLATYKVETTKIGRKESKRDLLQL